VPLSFEQMRDRRDEALERIRELEADIQRALVALKNWTNRQEVIADIESDAIERNRWAIICALKEE
jgi:hypothetical protein